VLTLLVSGLLAPTARAQEPPSPADTASERIGEVALFGEEELTIQAATKTEVPVLTAPGSVAVVTAKQIRESGAQDLAEVLRLVAGVNVRWNPMVQTLDVRGFGENPFSNRMLILIDGTPYNSGDTGGFPLSPALEIFPLQNIKRVEVIRGPGSALYGENAFWGVLNIVTLGGEDLRGFTASILGGDRHTERAGASYGQKWGDGALFASARWLRSQFPTELWEENDSRYEASDIFVKAKWKALQVSYSRHDDTLDGFREDFGPAEGFPPGTFFASADQLKQTFELANVKLDLGQRGAPVTFNANVGYSRRDGMHCAGCHAAAQEDHFRKRADHGYQAIADLRLGLHMIPSHNLLIGVEGRRLDRGDHQEELADFADAVSGYDKLAAYFQDQISLGPHLQAVAGVRYDQSTDLFDATTSPRLDLVWTPSSRVVVRAGGGTAFRFPSFSELYQDSWFLGVENELGLLPSFPLVVFAPNANLEPEEIRNYQLGTEVALSSEVTARLDLFRSRIDHFIVIGVGLAPPGQPSTLQFLNQPSTATINGGEIELKANLGPKVTGFVNYSREDPERSDDRPDAAGRPLELVYAPQNKASLGTYLGPWSGFRAALEVSWRDETIAPAVWYLVRSNFQDPTIRPLNAQTRLNLRLSYEVPLPGAETRALRFSVYGQNLLDERPEETLVGDPLEIAGREVFGEVALTF
jgi:iron complex outermembrane receptor protein